MGGFHFPTLVLRTCAHCGGRRGAVGLTPEAVAAAAKSLLVPCPTCRDDSAPVVKRLAAPSEVECRFCGDYAFLETIPGSRACPKCRALVSKLVDVPGALEWVETVIERAYTRGQENVEEALNS